MSDEYKSSIEQLTQLKQLNLNEITKPSWIHVFRKDFSILIKDVAVNFNNKDYKTTVNRGNYDFFFFLKKEFLLEVDTKKR